MKTLRLLLLGGVLILFLSPSLCYSQVYNGRRYVNPRLAPRMQAPQTRAATNAPPAVTNAPAVTHPPTPEPIVRTQMLVRVVQPPPDPEKVKAAKAEALRKTVEFQKKRADEGSESAQYELGLRYLKGEGVEKDEATGRRWLTMSAKNGYGPATKKLDELDNPPKPKEKEQ
jgi:TPR repeat protein